MQVHLGILQGVIERMAANSASAKAWCIALVSAILVVIADMDVPPCSLLALFPILMFCALDTYYLALERGFRAAYGEFVMKVHLGTLVPSDLYEVVQAGSMFKHQIAALLSFSIWGFYLVLIGLVLLAWRVVL